MEVIYYIMNKISIFQIYFCVHQLHQGDIFTDIIKNVKSALYIPLINIITEMLLNLLLCPVKNYCVSKYNSIIISIGLT